MGNNYEVIFIGDCLDIGVIEMGNQAFVAGLIIVQSLELGKNRSSKSFLWGLDGERKSVLDTLSSKSLGCPGCWLIYSCS